MKSDWSGSRRLANRLQQIADAAAEAGDHIFAVKACFLTPAVC
jgi:hypothetical protein